MKMTGGDVAQVFQEVYQERLHFLVKEMGFQTILSSDGTSLAYLQNDLAIEFSLDYRDRVVGLYLSFWPEARKRGVWQIGKGGRLVRASIWEFSESHEREDNALQQYRARWKNRGKKSRRFYNDPDTLREQFEEDAEYYALLLRKYGREIFARARERFGLPPEP